MWNTCEICELVTLRILHKKAGNNDYGKLPFKTFHIILTLETPGKYSKRYYNYDAQNFPQISWCLPKFLHSTWIHLAHCGFGKNSYLNRASRPTTFLDFFRGHLHFKTQIPEQQLQQLYLFGPHILYFIFWSTKKQFHGWSHDLSS